MIALDHPIVQVVSLSDPENPGIPAIGQTAAFLLAPGQAVMFDRGVWYSAGISLKPTLGSYMFFLGKATDDLGLHDSGLVPVAGGTVIKITNG